MSGTGYGSTGGSNRDASGLNAGTSGSASMGDRSGTGEVHSGLHSGGQRDDYSGIAFSGSAAGEQGGGVRDKVSGAARGAADSVRDQAGNVADRASGAASQAKGRLGALSDQANTFLGGRGVIARLQENPLPALGVAFAVGFLVAGGGNQSTRPNSPAARARQELRNALMAGLSSGVSQGARGFLDTAGRPEGFANSFLRNLLSNVLGGEQGGAQGGGQQGGQRATGGSTGASRTGGGQSRPPSHREQY